MENPHQNVPHAVLSARVTSLEAEIAHKNLKIEKLHTELFIQHNILGEREQEIRDQTEKIACLEGQITNLTSRSCCEAWSNDIIQPKLKYEVVGKRAGHVFAFPSGPSFPHGMAYAYCVGCGRPEHVIFPEKPQQFPTAISHSIGETPAKPEQSPDKFMPLDKPKESLKSLRERLLGGLDRIIQRNSEPSLLTTVSGKEPLPTPPQAEEPSSSTFERPCPYCEGQGCHPCAEAGYIPTHAGHNILKFLARQKRLPYPQEPASARKR